MRELRRLGGSSWKPAQLFDRRGSLLQETGASPALRAAVYRAAALIPGVQVLGSVRDRRGRRGLGVAISTREEREELSFNRHTAALMGMQTTSTLPGLSGWTVYFTSRLIDALPARPPAALAPRCATPGAGYVRTIPAGSIITGRPSGSPGRAGRPEPASAPGSAQQRNPLSSGSNAIP